VEGCQVAAPVVSRDTNFYYSFLVLSHSKRRAIIAVWDFCRAVDDAVDAPKVDGARAVLGEPALKAELERWRHELDCCFGESEPQTEQGRSLKPQVARFGLPREPFEDLIDGVEMDIGDRRYDTFDDLYQYCLRVASSVGLICIEIFGYQNIGSRDYAITLGVALQLTNIIRDVPTDLTEGRVYLPLEDLKRFGCTDQDLRRGMSSQVHALLEFESQRARGFYRKAREALPSEDATSLVAAQIMGAIYFEILERIQRRNYDVFSVVVRVPRPRRAVIATVVWMRTVLRRVFYGNSTRSRPK
jgi:phytoene synthase